MPTQNKFTRSIMERLEQEQQKERERQQEEKAASKAPKETPATVATTKVARTAKSVQSEHKENKSVANPSQLAKEEPSKPMAKKTSSSAVKEAKSTTITEEAEQPSAIPDLSQFITPKAERVAKNKTFYLDQEVIDALHQAAKAQNMTDSRLCNEILRGVLGLS